MKLIETVDESVEVSIGAKTWVGHSGGIEVADDEFDEVMNALQIAGQLFADADDPVEETDDGPI